MPLHVLGDLAVEVDSVVAGTGLPALLHELSFVPLTGPPRPAQVVLRVRMQESAMRIPSQARVLAESGGLAVYGGAEEALVTDGASVARLQPATAYGEAHLVPSFVRQPTLLHKRFWAYGLLTLLRGRGLFALHAAGVTSPCGTNLLLIGDSGTGKSTLALGLVHRGWRYLSDDAVLLRAMGERVEAVTLRRTFSVIAGGRKCAVDVRALHPDQHQPVAVPTGLVFPRIVARNRSSMRRLAQTATIARLLEHSGSELFDRHTMHHHLSALVALARQASGYELLAGRDLQGRPELLLEMLAELTERPDGTRHP